MDKQYTLQEIKEAKKALELKLYCFLSEEIDKFQSSYNTQVINITINYQSFRELIKMQDARMTVDVYLEVKI